eukprot:gene27447-4748_t
MILTKTGRMPVVAVRASQSSPKPASKPAPPTSSRSRRAMLSSIVLSGASFAGIAKADDCFKSAAARKTLGQSEDDFLKALNEEKALLEKEAFETQGGKLCATPLGLDVVGITELVALIGATVGGITARQRKVEVERLNEQLRQINISLRQQARSGTVYAPGLTYAPSVPPQSVIPSPSPSSGVATMAPPQPKPASSNFPYPSITLLSMDDEDMTMDQLECREALKAGKRMLKEKNGAGALVRFEKGLMLSKVMVDKVQERRAMRGLAAASRMQGQYKSAINYLEKVLLISAEMKEYTGDADAYGTIADCYTDLGNFEKAAMMYDKYIELMGNDGATSRLQLMGNGSVMGDSWAMIVSHPVPHPGRLRRIEGHTRAVGIVRDSGAPDSSLKKITRKLTRAVTSRDLNGAVCTSLHSTSEAVQSMGGLEVPTGAQAQGSALQGPLGARTLILSHRFRVTQAHTSVNRITMTDAKDTKDVKEVKSDKGIEAPANLEDDLFEEFTIVEDWASKEDDDKQPLWQADWDDEEDPNPDAPDFQAKLREQLGQGGAAAMKE